jgi:hypothetical protein
MSPLPGKIFSEVTMRFYSRSVAAPPCEARAFNLAQALEIEAAAAGGPADCDPRYRAINRAF